MEKNRTRKVPVNIILYDAIQSNNHRRVSRFLSVQIIESCFQVMACENICPFLDTGIWKKDTNIHT